ncbi:MAG: rod shape-determining protein MreB, partial [Clostridia bacterium]|nr:rod shape-determining protein MreB [Clostridia bacterium]
SGAKEVYIVEESMASAVGAGLPIIDPFGNMVLDIGGGTSEVAVISLGAIVTAKTVRVAGDAFDEAIANYIKKNHNLHIGDRTAEAVKIRIGSVYECTGLEDTMDVRGRDLISGLPRNIEITALEVREALEEPIRIIIDAVKETLETTPPELAADIVEKGITLTGGGALLRGLDALLTSETMLPVKAAENALDCVVLGAGLLLEEIDVLKILNNDRRQMKHYRC